MIACFHRLHARLTAHWIIVAATSAMCVAMFPSLLLGDTNPCAPGTMAYVGETAPTPKRATTTTDHSPLGSVFCTGLVILIAWCLWSRAKEKEKQASRRKQAERMFVWSERAAVRSTVDEKFSQCAALIEPHYTARDLQKELACHIYATNRTEEMHERARNIVAKIERFRAYEAVRAAYRAEVDALGAHFPYEAIAKDVDSILDPSLTASDVRTTELTLLARIKRLARHYDPNAEAPKHTRQEQLAMIETDVRREARPVDTEDDIQREIAHRRARLFESHRSDR